MCRPGWIGCRGPGFTGASSSVWAGCGSSTGSRSRWSATCRPASRRRAAASTLNPAEIGVAAAFYIAGACLGALFFGHLTDRFGRRNLFMLTLALYLVATVATAFAFAPWYFFIARFFTGSGIGGEYAAINSAIDELIPARVRGRVDLVINGTYWLGSAAGAAGALVLLDTSNFPAEHRMAARLRHRRHLRHLRPSCPAQRSGKSAVVVHSRARRGSRADRRRNRGGRGTANRPAAARAARAAAENSSARDDFVPRDRQGRFHALSTARGPWMALFIGQAFLYNGVTFNLGTLLSGFYGVHAATVPLFYILWALSNFFGPLVLGRLSTPSAANR